MPAVTSDAPSTKVSIPSVILEVDDLPSAESFYAAAFDLGSRLDLRSSAAPKSFYVEHGLKVAKSFGSRYVQFDTHPVQLALYRHRALAKDAGVPPEGNGSHRIAIRGADAPFTDPDGFAWESA